MAETPPFTSNWERDHLRLASAVAEAGAGRAGDYYALYVAYA